MPSHGCHPIKLTGQQKLRLWEMWHDESVRLYEIGQELGVSVSWLSRNRTRFGLPKRPRQPPDKVIVDPTPEEIAEECAKIRQQRLDAYEQDGVGKGTPYMPRCYGWTGQAFRVATP